MRVTVEQIDRTREEELIVRCYDPSAAWVSSVTEAASDHRTICGWQEDTMHRLRMTEIFYLVILGYLIFEMIPINYRPILIDGAMEASYPSSTTLLVLSVMPTLLFQVNRRAKSQTVRRITAAFVILFSAFMVIGRLVAGVHWLTDIVGSVLLSAGLYCLYRTAVTAMDHG